MDWPSSSEWVLATLKSKGGEDLVPSLKCLRNSAIPFLAKITETFPDYTIHDIRHKDAVCESLGMVLQSSARDQLSKYEFFFLISAVYLHDIGMADIPELFNRSLFLDWSRKQLKNPDLHETKGEYIREFHHLRSEEYINKNYRDFCIANRLEAFVIGRIARGHRRFEELTDFGNYPRKFVYKKESVNIASLAYFLQIADELDLTFERAPLSIYATFDPKNPISRIEWEKALSTSGACLDTNDNRTILVSALCSSEKVHRALLLLESEVQHKLDCADQILDPSQSCLFPNRIKFQITSSGYEFLDLKFIFDMKAMLPLLTDRIYSRPQDAIRELLQNSIDSCHHRSFTCRKEGRGYSPRISVRMTQSKDSSFLEVEDNGTGMDQHVLSSYFGKIGRSFYGSPEFLIESPDFHTIGEFGLGILSVFMIAEKALVETKAENSLAFNVEIFPWDDHIFAVKGTRDSVGTKVKLWLKRNIEIDIAREVAFYARHVDIPIEVKSEHQRTVVSQKWYTYDDMLVEQGFPRADSVKPLCFELKSERYRCLVSFPSKEYPTLGKVPCDLTHSVPEKATKLVAISRLGIFVEYLDIYELIRKWGIIASIDLDISTPIPVSIGRTSVRQSEQFNELISDIVEEILGKLGSLFDKYLQTDEIAFANISSRLLSSLFNFLEFGRLTRETKRLLEKYGTVLSFREHRLTAKPISAVEVNDLFVEYPGFLNSDEILHLLNSLVPESRSGERKPVNMYDSVSKAQASMLLLNQGKAVLLQDSRVLELLRELRGFGEVGAHFADFFSFESVFPPFHIRQGRARTSALPPEIDFEDLEVEFVHFTNCMTRNFIVALSPSSTIFEKEKVSGPRKELAERTRYVIEHNLFVNMGNPFSQAARNVFGESFREVIRPILKALLTHDFKAIVTEQKAALEKMRNLGVKNIEGLEFRREDIPLFIAR